MSEVLQGVPRFREESVRCCRCWEWVHYGCDGLTESEGEVSRRFVSVLSLINEHDILIGFGSVFKSYLSLLLCRENGIGIFDFTLAQTRLSKAAILRFCIDMLLLNLISWNRTEILKQCVYSVLWAGWFGPVRDVGVTK